MTSAEAAAMLKVSPDTIARMADRGELVERVKRGSRSFYRLLAAAEEGPAQRQRASAGSTRGVALQRDRNDDNGHGETVAALEREIVRLHGALAAQTAEKAKLLDMLDRVLSKS